MASTTFVDKAPPAIAASWLNDVNYLTYTLFNAISAIPSSGKILRSNGTNVVGSTSTFADTYTAGTILAAGSTNTVAGSTTPTLGASGTLGSLTMGNATSGLLTLQPVTGALGTVTVSLPAATDTLVGKATTDVLTNKTYDTAGAGNVLKINGTQVSTVTGTGSVTLATNPTFTGSIGIGGTAPAGGGAGISFPATQSASSDANTLDDYEEGTYTVTVGALSGSFTTVASSGRYIKIGKSVTIAVTISITNAGTAATGGTISLPFSAQTTTLNPLCGREDQATGFALSCEITGVTTALWQKYDGTFLGAAGQTIRIGGTYEATA